MIPKGTLIAIGGAEDKGIKTEDRRRLDFVSEGILSHVVNQAGGQDSVIKVISSASSIPEEVGAMYMKAFGKLKCQNVEVLHVNSQKSANSRSVIDKIAEADALMISGGNQNKLSEIFLDTESLALIHKRYEEEEFVIAGTSAGAVAMSEIMIAGGSSAEAMVKGAVTLRQGLGFINEVIFDSHFIQRGRFGRLTEAVALNEHKLGVGLGEDTGLIIKNGNDFLTIGSGMVLFFDGSKLDHNWAKELDPGIPISISNMIVHVLSNSDRYLLMEKRVEVLPIDAGFI